MSALHVVWHEDVLGHDTGRGLFEAGPSPLLADPEAHPENARRVANMRAALVRGPLARHLTWHRGRPATEEELLAFHPRTHVEAVRRLVAVDAVTEVAANTFASPGTWAAALASAGGALTAADLVGRGEAPVAYALVRPPGHHAAPERVEGYCFFNNSALAAERLRAHGAERVAIVDWDVHHGNGTQAGFYARGDVLTVSVHMDHGAWGEAHPETGGAEERGTGAGLGANLNVPLPYGAGDAAYAAAFAEVVVPALHAFAPDAIVGACGQDASQFDPNGRQALTMAGFHAVGAALREAADALTGGRLVLVQEGGYAPTYAALCLHETLAGVAGLGPQLEDPLAYLPDVIAAG